MASCFYRAPAALALCAALTFPGQTVAEEKTGLCAPAGRTMSALRVMGREVTLVEAPEIVDLAMRFLVRHGLEGAPEDPDSLFVVALSGERARISPVVDGCIAGIIVVDARTARAFTDVIDGGPSGRDV